MERLQITMLQEKTKARNGSVVWRSVRTILLTAFIILLVNIFLLGNFEVAGPSMMGELLEGDRVLVSKLHYGARISRMLKVPFVNHHSTLLQYLNVRLHSSPLLPYVRTFGFSELRRGDIVTFNLPTKENEYELNGVINKRIVGLPGDSILLVDGVLSFDQKKEESRRLTFGYDLRTSVALNAQAAAKWDIRDFKNQVKPQKNSLVQDFFEYEIYVNEETATKIKADPVTLRIARKKRDDFADFNTYPHWLPFRWNKDNFGKIVVPKKGLSLKMDSANIYRYFHLIKNFEANESIEILNGRLFVDNKVAPYYQFKKNYFFSLGDNRDSSMDSRHWGFIPEDHIIGKVILIYFSRDQNLSKIRWDRFFKVPQ